MCTGRDLAIALPLRVQIRAGFLRDLMISQVQLPRKVTQFRQHVELPGEMGKLGGASRMVNTVHESQ